MVAIEPGLRSRSVAFAKTIADELERPDQTYLLTLDYGIGPQVMVTQQARDMVERYVRRAIEADRKARACAGAG
jgi:hypothetical protein